MFREVNDDTFMDVWR